MEWSRFAIYWAPAGKLGALGARWLGWDLRRSAPVPGPVAIAPAARPYGFHATLKPPFRLAPDCCEADMVSAARALFAGLPPADLGCLDIATAGDFCALRPTEPSGIAAVAAAAVERLDRFRAPITGAELARRRARDLTAAQAALLDRWGYPYVFEEFRPHLTLSDPTPPRDLVETARGHFGSVLGHGIGVDAVSLVGEDALGRFHLIEDLPLGHGVGASTSRDDSAASIAQ